MFALVESGSITKMLMGNQGVEINGIKHSRDIFAFFINMHNDFLKKELKKISKVDE